ncbi:branched-chain amino acid ABC transporter permease [Bradyrhizobium sp. 31Argb]|uniref:branched-chain amino acid ABC transporter permease n=1 Tax=unclassified Bradyrhizobium TaxID=2631580 RepID=UPI001FE21444|nr:branched-chain amino acid ABC transporter permease [Bradyrhizobium sp. Leo170]
MSEAAVLEQGAKASTMRPLVWAAVAIGLLVLCAAPLGISSYWLRVLTTVLMYVIVTQGLNVIVGITGYHAFGNGVFFGIGAYACGTAMVAGLPFVAGIALAIVMSAVCAFILGWPILRLKGHYFAIATVALNLAAVQIIIQIGGITGGAQGLALPLSDWDPKPLYIALYYLMLGGAVASTAIVAILLKRPLGFALRAIRDSERAAAVMGINTTKAKVYAWAISAGLTGFAGGVWAYWITFIEPSSAFDPAVGVKAYIMLIIGGMGSILGPVIGAFVLEIVSTLVWSGFLKAHQLILGLLIVVVCIVAPNGIINAFARLVRSVRRNDGAA